MDRTYISALMDLRLEISREIDRAQENQPLERRDSRFQRLASQVLAMRAEMLRRQEQELEDNPGPCGVDGCQTPQIGFGVCGEHWDAPVQMPPRLAL